MFLEEPLAEIQPSPAVLALEDGRIFNGRAAGARTRRGGEVVFNTSLTGYQEVFTDPSYSGQIVCLTYPHIGNVGTNLDDEESPRPFIEALIVREFSVPGFQLAFHGDRRALPESPWHSRDLGSGYPRPGSAHPPRRSASRHGLHRRHARRTTGQRGARASLHERPGTGQPRELPKAVSLGARLGVCLFAWERAQAERRPKTSRAGIAWSPTISA